MSGKKSGLAGCGGRSGSLSFPGPVCVCVCVCVCVRARACVCSVYSVYVRAYLVCEESEGTSEIASNKDRRERKGEREREKREGGRGAVL